jgi:hypothetical protein
MAGVAATGGRTYAAAVPHLAVEHGIAELRPNTDPASIAAALAPERPLRLQCSQQLSDEVLDAAAAALEEFPEVGFRIYGRDVDPSLGWLKRFSHVRDLSVDVWHATSFDVLASFQDLRKLSLGETASKRPSLAFLRQLPQLEVLRVEAHDRGFEAIADVQTLRELHLRTPRAKSLHSLRGHPNLQVVAIDFGGIRDLAPLGELPRLRALELWQVRKLDTNDFDAVGSCRSLVAVSLGALRNVTRLTALARGPHRTLRYLTLEQMGGLETLADLAACDALEQVYLAQSKPKDGRLDVIARGESLRHLVVGDAYPKRQVDAIDTAFAGETLWVRGKALRGDAESSDVVVRWRRPVGEYLSEAASSASR